MLIQPAAIQYIPHRFKFGFLFKLMVYISQTLLSNVYERGNQDRDRYVIN